MSKRRFESVVVVGVVIIGWGCWRQVVFSFIDFGEVS
jgi:hypothetical protein